MAYEKQIVCLANSRKINGRCIAGKVIGGGDSGEWIRPVGAAEHGELFSERLYANGTDPQLLDIIRIKLVRRTAHGCQTENHLVDLSQQWAKEGTLSWQNLVTLVDDVQLPLWYDGVSSGNGLNDRIPAEIAAALPKSLALIEVKDLELRLGVEGAYFGNPRRKVRAHFVYKDTEYVFAVTDQNIEMRFTDKPAGYSETLPVARLCLSIGEPYQGACYKLVAGILTP
jgi:hypothetical protein